MYHFDCYPYLAPTRNYHSPRTSMMDSFQRTSDFYSCQRTSSQKNKLAFHSSHACSDFCLKSIQHFIRSHVFSPSMKLISIAPMILCLMNSCMFVATLPSGGAVSIQLFEFITWHCFHAKCVQRLNRWCCYWLVWLTGRPGKTCTPITFSLCAMPLVRKWRSLLLLLFLISSFCDFHFCDYWPLSDLHGKCVTPPYPLMAFTSESAWQGLSG